MTPDDIGIKPMATLITRLRTACSPEIPLGKLFSEAADEIERLNNKDLVRAGDALLGNIWQLAYSASRTHEENWVEFERRFPGVKWLHEALKEQAHGNG